MIRCYHCGEEMIWNNDFDFEDVGREGDGVASFFHCPNCGTEAEIYVPNDFERDE